MPPPRRAVIRRANKSFSATETTTTKKQPGTDFEIRIYDQPHYVPGQTPPQPPISLVPPRDTDAFIVDKVVTPFHVPPEQEQTVRRVLNYVVGWPDRPLERQLVPCTQILDYVSPRELEDWEYALMLRQQREKDEAEAAKQNKITRQAANGAGAGAYAGDAGELQRQKKRRRISPSSGGALEHRRGPGRKRRGHLPHMTDLTEGAAAAAAAAAAAIAAFATAPQDVELLPRPPSAHLLAQSLPLLGAGNQRTGLPLTFPVPLPLQKLTGELDVESSNEGGEDAGLSLGEHAAAAATMTDEGDEGDEGDDGDDSDLAHEKIEEWPGGDGGRSTVETPSGLDTASMSSQDGDEEPAIRGPAVLTAKTASWTSALGASGARNTPQQLQQPPPPLPKYQARLQSRPDLQSPRRVSYIPPPVIPTVKHEPRVTPIRPPKIPGMPPPALSNKATSNAPLVVGPQPPKKRKHEVPEEAMEEADGEEGEDLYEVDRLEDDLITKADGEAEPVRFFLVRWKGDWPPDQNPTWEPAENLPPHMVRRYLKKAARKRKTEPARKIPDDTLLNNDLAQPGATRPVAVLSGW